MRKSTFILRLESSYFCKLISGVFSIICLWRRRTKSELRTDEFSSFTIVFKAGRQDGRCAAELAFIT